MHSFIMIKPDAFGLTVPADHYVPIATRVDGRHIPWGQYQLFRKKSATTQTSKATLQHSGDIWPSSTEVLLRILIHVAEEDSGYLKKLMEEQ